MSSTKPLVVTAGEPAGIGPELCLTLAGRSTPTIVVSDADLLRERAARTGAKLRISEVSPSDIGERAAENDELLVVHVPFPEADCCGQPRTVNAPVLLEGLRFAVDGCLQKRFSGIVTAPLQKSIINDAGIPFSGHTEFLAEATGASFPVMLLVADDLRVALASTHLPLRDVPDYLNRERLRTVIKVLFDDLRRKFGIVEPEVVVCGLNPHAGEGGHLGTEDQDVIAPVVAEFVDRGEKLRGPLPADTAFTPSAGHKDAVLAMYHDQGLPVLKYAGFGHAVNVTLGLPIVRTSVDHGTALDIAGTGTADPGSLLAAVDLASRMTAKP